MTSMAIGTIPFGHGEKSDLIHLFRCNALRTDEELRAGRQESLGGRSKSNRKSEIKEGDSSVRVVKESDSGRGALGGNIAGWWQKQGQESQGSVDPPFPWQQESELSVGLFSGAPALMHARARILLAPESELPRHP
jgi:hypothetical protein